MQIIYQKLVSWQPIEFKKEINSGDSSGNDIQWSENNTYSLVIMWDSNGRGSSGGSANHSSRPLIGRTVLINPDIIPEFSGLLPLILIIIISLPVILRKLIKGDNQKYQQMSWTKLYFNLDIRSNKKQ